jgi:hypothetical protein
MAKQRHTENMTETGDEILIGCLLKIVVKESTDYIKVKEIHEFMVKQFEDREDWLTNKWIGNALRRLGFTEKRRVGSGYEYKISYSDLEDLKKRMQIEESPEPESEKATMVSLKDWCKTEQATNGSSEISLIDMQNFIEKTLHISDSSTVVEHAKKLEIIMPGPPGKVIVL